MPRTIINIYPLLYGGYCYETVYGFGKSAPEAEKIIGLVIGVLVLGAGIYYLVKEKNDPESKKIYTVVSVIGGVIAAVCAVLLFV